MDSNTCSHAVPAPIKVAKGTINTMLKFCEAYNVTPNDILYKFIQKSNAKKDSDEYEKKFMKLSKKDKKVIYTLIDALLEK